MKIDFIVEENKIKIPDPLSKGMSIDEIMVRDGVACECELIHPDDGSIMKCGESCNGSKRKICYDYKTCPDRAQYEKEQYEKEKAQRES